MVLLIRQRDDDDPRRFHLLHVLRGMTILAEGCGQGRIAAAAAGEAGASHCCEDAFLYGVLW